MTHCIPHYKRHKVVLIRPVKECVSPNESKVQQLVLIREITISSRNDHGFAVLLNEMKRTIFEEEHHKIKKRNVLIKC